MGIGHEVRKGPIEKLLEMIVCHNTNCKIAHIHLTLLFLGRQTAGKTLWEEFLDSRLESSPLINIPRFFVNALKQLNGALSEG